MMAVTETTASVHLSVLQTRGGGLEMETKNNYGPEEVLCTERDSRCTTHAT
jgi:hypothetical protein